MVTPLGERMLRAKELECERIKSEIRRNEAEAKRMLAEAKSFKESKLIIFIQYFLSALIGGILIVAFSFDTFKNLYDITCYRIKENKEIQKKISGENEKLKADKKKLEKGQALLSHENEELKLEKNTLQKERVEFAAHIRVVEKRYLEALMRQAYSNAYNAYVQLVRRQEIYLTGEYASEEKAQRAYIQACQSLHDYWQLVVKLAQETQADLFSEVKEELSDWLQQGEKESLFSGECRGAGILSTRLTFSFNGS